MKWLKKYFTTNNKENQKGYYTIVAPSTIQSDFGYDIAVTLHQHHVPVTIRVGISGPSYNERHTIHINPFSTQIVHIDVPTLQNGYYELQAEGLSGLAFKESSRIEYKSVLPKVYIQTDKAKYKPGDVVQYRILALDENLKPAKGNWFLTLEIQDGSANKIKKIKDMKFEKGVHSGKFQLSDQPVLGDWEMEITQGNDRNPKAFKKFEVAKYVLPKFSVELETAKAVAIIDREVKITLRSKYTYGQPVKGKATIKVNIVEHPSPSPDSQMPVAEKTIDIDGIGEVEFDLMDDLKMDQYKGYDLPEIHVEAFVTEALTGLEQSTKTEIRVEKSRYTIHVAKMASSYEINQPFEITATIKKLNGSPLTDARSTAKLFVGQRVFESKVDNMGVVIFKLKLSEAMYYNNVEIKFEEKVQYLNGFYVRDPEITSTSSTATDIGSVTLFPKTRDLEIGEEIVIDVKSVDAIPYFLYTVMARGKIVRHEYVQVDDDKKCVTIKIKATLDMAPKANFFVYFVKDGHLKHDEIIIKIPYKFGNQLKLSAPEQARPGDMVTFNIETDPQSYVGLLGVDQSILLLQTGNDLNATQIFNDLNNYESYSHFNDRKPGSNSGLVTISNALPPLKIMYRSTSYGRDVDAREALLSAMLIDSLLTSYRSNTPEIEDGSPIKPKIRKDFVESWIFDSIESTDANGMAKFTKKIPDTITSWIITGFSLNDHTGLGMTENATKIRVFQPFFLSTNLPYSIKRGEVVTIPVTIFNYMETETEAQITMENEYKAFDFIDDNEVISHEKQKTKKVIVPANGGKTVSFTICPNIVGEITLMIKAITPVAGDTIHQKLKVEPEGVTQFTNEAIFITVPSGKTVTHTLKANIPSDAIVDSEYLEFSVVGNILGPTIKNMDQLVRMPYGCGEQNMINFVPNILVLDYLTAIKADMPSVVEKATLYMEIGYQSELTYKHKNGAYSAFGEGSSGASSWLTAYVVRSFIQAQKYMTISENVIEEAIGYLISTQKPNGQFPQTGRLFDTTTNQKDVGLSAFIMLALLEDEKYALKYKAEIKKGLNYLSENVEHEDDAYTMSLVALLFQKVKHLHSKKLVEKLKVKANSENNLKWWGKTSQSYSNNNIEITAYALQILVETEEAGDILPIIRWLIGQRNSLGGFNSTQDTVVGLQALIKFAEKFSIDTSDSMVISFAAQDSEGVDSSKDMFEINRENSLVLQSYVLPKSSRQLTLTCYGIGSTLVQLSYRYNTTSHDAKPSFVIQHTHKPSLHSGQLLMNVCVEYKPLTSEMANSESNMAVMEINLPSGYTTDDSSLEKIRDLERIKLVETRNSETTIIVYFERLLAGQPIYLDVAGERSHTVGKLKPAVITIYDYYNTNARATEYYEL